MEWTGRVDNQDEFLVEKLIGKWPVRRHKFMGDDIREVVTPWTYQPFPHIFVL